MEVRHNLIRVYLSGEHEWSRGVRTRGLLGGGCGKLPPIYLQHERELLTLVYSLLNFGF